MSFYYSGACPAPVGGAGTHNVSSVPVPKLAGMWGPVAAPEISRLDLPLVWGVLGNPGTANPNPWTRTAVVPCVLLHPMSLSAPYHRSVPNSHCPPPRALPPAWPRVWGHHWETSLSASSWVCPKQVSVVGGWQLSRSLRGNWELGDEGQDGWGAALEQVTSSGTDFLGCGQRASLALAPTPPLGLEQGWHGGGGHGRREQ